MKIQPIKKTDTSQWANGGSKKIQKSANRSADKTDDEIGIVLDNRLRNKKQSNRLRRFLIITVLLILAAVLIVGILVGFDYLNYKSGNRTVLFGTLDGYSRSQTLRYGNLDLKVNSVMLNSYPEPTLSLRNCDGLSTVQSVGRLFTWSPYSQCVDMNSANTDYYNTEKSHHNSKNEISVQFEYSNISDKPINLSDYKVKLVANTALGDYSSPLKSCSGMASNNSFLKGYVEKECLVKDLDKGYNGPLAFSVTKGGKEKIINLSIPNSITP
jgi:hypothetical protein